MLVYIGPMTLNFADVPRNQMLNVDSASWHGMLNTYGLRWALPEFHQALKTIRMCIVDARVQGAFKVFRSLPYGYDSYLGAESAYEWLFTKIKASTDGDVVAFFMNSEISE